MKDRYASGLPDLLNQLERYTIHSVGIGTRDRYIQPMWDRDARSSDQQEDR